jgi:hypothetical protein
VDSMTTATDRTDHTGRCAYQIDAGAFVMGGLGAEEHQRFGAHLVDCDRCNADIAEVLPVLALLESTFASGATRAEDDPSTGLRQRVVAAVERAGNEAVLASVRELRPAAASSTSLSEPGISPSSSGSSSLSSGAVFVGSAIATGGPGLAAFSALEAKGPGSVSELVRSKRFDRRFLAVAAAAVLAIGLTVAGVRKSNTPGTSYQLVALQKDPLRATAKINTKNDTTVAEFVVTGTIPDEVYFAWFEDPEGKRIGLGSFRGAAGKVRFRGQTGVARSTIVAIGASTRIGDKPTDRIRAELPKRG